jgi:hypothetical protein
VRTETIRARGHEHVRATHGTTFEVTTDDWLTPAGDCILAVEADRAPAGFAPEFVAACRDAEARMGARIRVAADDGTREAVVAGRGHPELTFADDRGAVVRTSDSVGDRTVLLGADEAAADLDRGLVAALADGAALELALAVEPSEA